MRHSNRTPPLLGEKIDELVNRKRGGISTKMYGILHYVRVMLSSDMYNEIKLSLFTHRMYIFSIKLCWHKFVRIIQSDLSIILETNEELKRKRESLNVVLALFYWTIENLHNISMHKTHFCHNQLFNISWNCSYI